MRHQRGRAPSDDQPVGDTALSADLLAQVRLRVYVKGPLMHKLAQRVRVAPVVQVLLFVC